MDIKRITGAAAVILTAALAIVLVFTCTIWGSEKTSEVFAEADPHELKDPVRVSDDKVTWDCVWLGSYPQSDENGETKEPIKWRVLDVNGNDAFLLADQILDNQIYHNGDEGGTWENCTFRSWLNNEFYDAAFSSSEKSAVKTVTVPCVDSYFTDEKDTLDKIFILSWDEVANPSYGFLADAGEWDAARRAKNTAYASAQGAYTVTTSSSVADGNGP